MAARRDRPATVDVGSKWGYTYTADWRIDADRHEVKDHSLATFRRQLAETPGAARRPPRPLPDPLRHARSGVLEDAAVLEALARAARRTAWRSASRRAGPGQAETLEPRARGSAAFDAVQATWNLLEPSAGPALERAHAAGWA